MNLIFDLDGTLLYTLADLKTSVNFALKKFGFPTKTLEEIQNAVGNGLKMLIFHSLPDDTPSPVVDAVLAEMKQHYAAHCYDQTMPYDGITEMLRSLKDAGHRIAIVSNKANVMVQTLKNVYFDGLIDFAVGESEIHQRKPAPDMVFAAMDALGKDAIYIGDSEVDIQTAKNANIPCLSVGWGYRSAEFLLQNGAERMIQTPLELIKNIKERLFVELAQNVRNCEVCKYMLTMPHIANPEYLVNDDHGLNTDNPYVNLWNLWHGNINADIMVIGQDFGQWQEPQAFYNKQFFGKYDSHTDQALSELFEQIFGMNLVEKDAPLFFANIANCYRKQKTTGTMHSGWLPICANKFMARLITIIQPKVIIVLGKAAFEAMYCLEGMPIICKNPSCSSKDSLDEIMNHEYYLVCNNKEVRVFPVYHPGANSIRNRSKERQLADWRAIKKYYDAISG